MWAKRHADLLHRNERKAERACPIAAFQVHDRGYKLSGKFVAPQAGIGHFWMRGLEPAPDANHVTVDGLALLKRGVLVPALTPGEPFIGEATIVRPASLF